MTHHPYQIKYFLTRHPFHEFMTTAAGVFDRKNIVTV
jgi:hypothetical protein